MKDVHGSSNSSIAISSDSSSSSSSSGGSSIGSRNTMGHNSLVYKWGQRQVCNYQVKGVSEQICRKRLFYEENLGWTRVE